MIGIIDYGMGNLRSVQKAFERLRIPANIISDPKAIPSVEKLVLPGVGHFDGGMKKLKDKGWISTLNEEILEKNKPILGICLGMQLLTKYSEEGYVEGLGLIDAITLKFNHSMGELKIPHMGWNEIAKAKESSLLADILVDDMVYFVHSYYVECKILEDVLCTTKYGINFHSAFQYRNIVGYQFHPEKSHKTGLTLLRNFVAL